ncbi:hypothetical protein [Kineosporia sp. R_H_3]|uniref:hypothetical protein n=1 Tax=Kineosporia sp. R_H_3 TaxID=1961848 RepID=UPI000B4ADED6|nr:hypothetical protein [Kineosporia sp. R_H_3]
MLAVATETFGPLHVPLYGWCVLVLDFEVRLLLGAVPMLGKSWGALAIAQTVADLAGWWLR